MCRGRSDRSGSVESPRTVVGRWMQGLLLRDGELRDEMEDRLNGGSDIGWNDDEPAVMQAAFEIAINRFYAGGYDVKMVRHFAEATLEALGAEAVFTKLEAEAIIRSSLGDSDVQVEGISAGKKIQLTGPGIGIVAKQLNYSGADKIGLIIAAEKLAFERGFNPPLA